MGDMEWSLMESQKEDHKAVVATISNLERLGYLIEGVHCKNGVLNITCRPPRNDGSGGGNPSLEKGLSMDGMSGTFKV
jgi:hypothetical protein